MDQSTLTFLIYDSLNSKLKSLPGIIVLKIALYYNELNTGLILFFVC